MSILEYNGSAVLAMTGRECVAIATDLRLGVGPQTVSTEFGKVFPVGERVYVGFAGLATDVLTVHEHVRFRAKLYKLSEGREMSPAVLGKVLSNMLFERRFAPWFVEPIVAGLSPDGTPYITAMDHIGAQVYTDDFVVSGTCAANMYGTCETLYEPGMDPEALFETASQALLSAVDRDALSGWGAEVRVITKEGVITRRLKARMD